MTGLLSRFRLIPVKKMVFLFLTFSISVASGFILRFFYADYLGQTLANHINIEGAFVAFNFIFRFITDNLINLNGLLFILLIGFAEGFCFIYCIKQFIKGRFSNNNLVYFLLAGFANLQFFSCLIVFILSGKIALRYYLPLTIFPFLGLWPFWLYWVQDKEFSKEYRQWGLIIMMFLGLYSLPFIKPLLSAQDLPGLQCLNEALRGKNLHGYAQYWAAKALNVYGHDNYRILQTTILFEALPWQDNLMAYQSKLHFILANDKVKGWYRSGISSQEVNFFIGKASKIINCSPLHVHFFNDNTVGFKKLNHHLELSFDKITVLRSKHQLNQFFRYI